MEGAPEGYRKNVGICLINSSNKVTISRFFFFLPFLFSQDSDLSNSLVKIFADSRCVEDQLPWILANAAGDSHLPSLMDGCLFFESELPVCCSS